MKNKINPATFYDFAEEMNTLREIFPEFAKEIDKCFWDVGQNFVGCCGDANCYCHVPFEEFHSEKNRIFKTSGEVNYEFN